MTTLSSITLAGRPIRELDLDSFVFMLFHGRESPPASMGEVANQLATLKDAILIPHAAGGSWYPSSIYSPICQNQPALTQSINRVEAIVRILESQGVRRKQIILGGFSQGACLVAQFLLQRPARYGLATIFSGGALGLEHELVNHPGSLEQTPILLSSSRADPYIRWSRIEKTADLLRTMGGKTTLLGYEQTSHAVTFADYAPAQALLRKVRETAGEK